jgi:DNA-binding transcriptional MerR regulator
MDMRIDDLSRRSGVPTRTIRYYTQQGLLPSPRLRGRVGFYAAEHVDRLRLIKELQEKRFLPLSVIRTVVRKFEEGADLDVMLAPLELVFAPRWESQNRVELTRTELAEDAGVDGRVVDAAEEMGFLFPVRRGRERRYTQDDVQMLDVAKEWLGLGLPRDLGRLYRDTLEQISRRQVEAFNDSVAGPVAQKDLTPDETRDELVDGYRAMSRTFNRLVGLLHRKLLQQAVEAYVEDVN